MRLRWVIGVLVLVLLLVAGAGLLLPARPVADHPYLRQGEPGPLVIAHRGSAALWPENTLYAFERAAALGTDVMETDVRATADGVLVLLHDATVNRTTDGSGAVAALTLAELKRLDAGARWSPDGGRSFPHRGQGLTVPTLAEAFAALPGMRFNLEMKEPTLAAPLCQALREHGMARQAMVASFSDSALGEFRRLCPEVATSASAAEARNFYLMATASLDNAYRPAMQALQVPEYMGGLRVLTPAFMNAARRLNLQVHAWTINDTEAMRRILALGVDGIITDYPDRLVALLDRDGDREDATGEREGEGER
ncbi:MAG: glycerophosphodiester phosphodiesterase [Gemmatimonadetes bacterium]|nr:glycerophosphodiester phosphodiesterase [Gemmatimonadota bacterium]